MDFETYQHMLVENWKQSQLVSLKCNLHYKISLIIRVILQNRKLHRKSSFITQNNKEFLLWSFCQVHNCKDFYNSVLFSFLQNNEDN